jgi:hypothetical protein
LETGKTSSFNTCDQFKLSVRHDFDFLRTEQDFNILRESDCEIVFTSGKVFVRVRFSPDSGEIDASIGIGDCDSIDREEYPIQEVARVELGASAGRFPDSTVSASSHIPAGVSRLAYLVRTYGARAVEGDPSIFLALSDEAIRATLRMSNVGAARDLARRKIERAWATGNYRLVARLFAWLDESTLSSDEAQRRFLSRKVYLSHDDSGTM